MRFKVFCGILSNFFFLLTLLGVCNSFKLEIEGDSNFSVAYEKYAERKYDSSLKEARKCMFVDFRCLSLVGDLEIMSGAKRNFVLGISKWIIAAENGNADAQYNMALVHATIVNFPRLDCDLFLDSNSTLVTKGDCLVPISTEISIQEKLLFYEKKIEDWLSSTNSTDISNNLKLNDDLAVINLYAASLAGHPGALLSLAYRHEKGYGVPLSCRAASLNYLEVAKSIIGLFSTGLPQSNDLVRLSIPYLNVNSDGLHRQELAIHVAENGNPTIQLAVGKRFLLGIDSFEQNFKQAYRFLKLAANGNNGEAQGLLGYIYALGLGIEKDVEKAAYYFSLSAYVNNDPVGHNGMGYLYFFGTNKYEKNTRMAFHHFNESAYHQFPDAQFNLASMYLTGSGTDQSFQNALLWFTRALEQGHTPAAYALAQMHLHGLGILKDCVLAVEFLKRVCERGGWVAESYNMAKEAHESKQYDRSAFLYWKLAEMGHDISQTNLAFIIENHNINLFPPISRNFQNYYAQKYLEFSFEKGNVVSTVKLGDFAYKGYGFNRKLVEKKIQYTNNGWLTHQTFNLTKSATNYDLAIQYYRIAAHTIPKSTWMLNSVSNSNFNLAMMYQFGLGVDQDFVLARQYYSRILTIQSDAKTSAIIKLCLYFLSLHKLIYTEDIRSRLYAITSHHYWGSFLVTLVIAFILFIVRVWLTVTR